MAKICLNKACEWHNHKDGGCLLFPGDFGPLLCKYADERTERKPAKENNKKGKK